MSNIKFINKMFSNARPENILILQFNIKKKVVMKSKIWQISKRFSYHEYYK